MLLALSLLLATDPAPVIVHREKSQYATVLVVDRGHQRGLYFDSIDGDLQSVIDLRDPRALPMDYLRVATGGLAFTKGRTRALMIGLGGGAFPMMLRRHLQEMTVDAVEIDPVVVDVAKRYFGVTDDIHITVGDGARYVASSTAQYDFILIDAYSGDGIPDHLTKTKFFESVRARLTKEGVAVANIAIHRKGEERALVSTIARVFPGCTILRGKERGNVIVVAQQQPPPAPRTLRRAFVDVSEELRLPFSLPKAVTAIDGCT